EDKKSCSAILESPAANLVGSIKWSDVGLLYFLSCFFTLLSGIMLNIYVVGLLFLLHMIPVLYSFYSIYYQSLIARSYCILCLAIQLTTWLILALYLINTAEIIV